MALRHMRFLFCALALMAVSGQTKAHTCILVDCCMQAYMALPHGFAFIGMLLRLRCGWPGLTH